MRGRWWLVALLCAWAEGAAAAELPLQLLDAGAIRVDGALGDWRGLRMASLGSGTDAAMKYVLGYDDAALYVAADVKDDALVRTRAPGRGEDAVVVTLVISTTSGTRVVELWLFAGITGEQAASASLGTPAGGLSPIAGASIVEGPAERGNGYVLEARVPWASIPGGDQWVGSTGMIALHDVDRDGRAQDVASARFDPRHPEQLPRLAPSGMAAATLQSFMAAKGLSATARFDLRGDVAGDGRPEQVAIVDVHLVVLGPGIRGGQSYSFFQLPAMRSSDVISAELNDVTGDGKQELLVKVRQQNDLGARDLLQVFDFVTEQPRVIFNVELRKQTRDGEVSAELSVERGKRGKPPTLRIRPAAARGLSATNFRDGREAGVEPLLVPWGDVTERQYQWDGTRMIMSAEKTAEGRRAAPEVATAAPVATRGAPEQPAAPPGIDELVDAFRRAQRIDRRVEARFKRNANVAEDERVEQLMVFDKSLLVIGPGYRGGSGYFFYALPVQSGDDVLRLFAADVTGDGRAEIFVRVRQWIGEVKRELLYVHQLDGDAFAQLLVVEVRRALGDSAIGNVVRLSWQGMRATLVIHPGQAVGWTRESYPYVTDTSDGTQALLLPWSDAAVTYRWDGSRLAH